MNDRSRILNLQSYSTLLSAISSRESEGGVEHCALVVGQTIDQYGRAAVLASLSARQAKVVGLLTSGTYGPRGSISSSRADLRYYLENNAIGSPASTANRGQLNPEHSRWLMGYPIEWGLSGATAMQLCRKSRKRSSKRMD